MNRRQRSEEEERRYLTSVISAIRSDMAQPDALNSRILKLEQEIENLQKRLAAERERKANLSILLEQHEARLRALKPVIVDPRVAKLLKLKGLISELEQELDATLGDC